MSIGRHRPAMGKDGPPEMEEHPDGEWVHESDIRNHVDYWLGHYQDFCGILNRELAELRAKNPTPLQDDKA